MPWELPNIFHPLRAKCDASPTSSLSTQFAATLLFVWKKRRKYTHIEGEYKIIFATLWSASKECLKFDKFDSSSIIFNCSCTVVVRNNWCFDGCYKVFYSRELYVIIYIYFGRDKIDHQISNLIVREQQQHNWNCFSFFVGYLESTPFIEFSNQMMWKFHWLVIAGGGKLDHEMN